MAFVDYAKIELKAGHGGNGIVSFRREKFVPNGGPFGGNGGHGGNIVFQVDEGLRTLMDFRYNRHFKAKPGQNGMTKGKTGRSADDLIIKVPMGTLIKDAESNEILADLTKPNEKVIIAKGGRGGRGNMAFATPKNSAPEIAENGEPGEEKTVILELKLLADVGLVGYPSVGKSTLLSVVSNAKPKIADYHFTTIDPNIGVVKVNDTDSFVMADLPGLIDGASQGIGLGFKFLKHIERTKLIVHLVSMDRTDDDRDPIEKFKAINQELSTYDNKLLKLPQIVVATKMDITGAKDEFLTFKRDLENVKIVNVKDVLSISSVTHQGIDELLNKINQTLKTLSQRVMKTNDEEKIVNYNYDDQKSEDNSFKITRLDGHLWQVSGYKVEKLLKMTNTQYEQSLLRFARQLKSMGIDEALAQAGAQDGDTVQILDFTFEYMK
ncbi:MAG: GTPase ObgE [Firmicutes bacterium]|uniref:GTPase Obg n=1 Tax=Candidatus Gallilactobacillus intestinavium TaxID=2840838 RepID=A0A9D9H9X1_9LACO|nr:GTPase ObgE [Candidatus Gallilactobacillus intestinavium]